MRINRPRLLLCGSLLALSLAAGAPAHASHYFLADISDAFTPLMVSEFTRFGFETTEDLLRNVDTVDERNSFAQVTGIPASELHDITRMCDFLQIEGVGPKAATLLMAAGVSTVADLAEREPSELTAELVAANAVQHITGVDPDVSIVEAWVFAAAQVPIQVAY